MLRSWKSAAVDDLNVSRQRFLLRFSSPKPARNQRYQPGWTQTLDEAFDQTNEVLLTPCDDGAVQCCDPLTEFQ